MFPTIGFVMLHVMMHTNRVHAEECGYIQSPEENPLPLNVCFNSLNSNDNGPMDYVSIQCNSTLDESYTYHYGANDSTCSGAPVSTDTVTSLTAKNYSYHCSDTPCPYYHVETYFLVNETNGGCEKGDYDNTLISVIDQCYYNSGSGRYMMKDCTSSSVRFDKYSDSECTQIIPYSGLSYSSCRSYMPFLDILHCDAPAPTTRPTAYPTVNDQSETTATSSTTDVKNTESDAISTELANDHQSGGQVASIGIVVMLQYLAVLYS